MNLKREWKEVERTASEQQSSVCVQSANNLFSSLIEFNWINELWRNCAASLSRLWLTQCKIPLESIKHTESAPGHPPQLRSSCSASANECFFLYSCEYIFDCGYTYLLIEVLLLNERFWLSSDMTNNEATHEYKIQWVIIYSLICRLLICQTVGH